MDSNGKKIHFAVPALQNPLDSKAAEHIRRRRPTPATLVVYRDTSACTGPPPQRKRSVYTPPTLIERELPEHSRNQEMREIAEITSGSTPRRKDTPYQHLSPFSPGGRLLENHSPFSEEEEQEEEAEEAEEERKGVPQ